MDYKKAVAIAVALEAAEQNAVVVIVQNRSQASKLGRDMNRLFLSQCEACGSGEHQALTSKYKRFLSLLWND